MQLRASEAMHTTFAISATTKNNAAEVQGKMCQYSSGQKRPWEIYEGCLTMNERSNASSANQARNKCSNSMQHLSDAGEYPLPTPADVLVMYFTMFNCQTNQ